jgi:hypothetical protein
MNRSRIATAALLASFAFGARAEPLKVEADYQLHEGHPAIVFTVKNQSIGPISISRADLPWGRAHSVIIIAYDLRARKLLPTTFPSDDIFLSPKTNIDPAQSVSGPVDLELHVDGINRTLASSDVLVFWHFNAQASNEAPLGEYGGWVRVPARSKGAGR